MTDEPKDKIEFTQVRDLADILKFDSKTCRTTLIKDLFREVLDEKQRIYQHFRAVLKDERRMYQYFGSRGESLPIGSSRHQSILYARKSGLLYVRVDGEENLNLEI